MHIPKGRPNPKVNRARRWPPYPPVGCPPDSQLWARVYCYSSMTLPATPSLARHSCSSYRSHFIHISLGHSKTNKHKKVGWLDCEKIWQEHVSFSRSYTRQGRSLGNVCKFITNIHDWFLQSKFASRRLAGHFLFSLQNNDASATCLFSVSQFNRLFLAIETGTTLEAHDTL
jgi:hypothetical protein